MMIECSGVLYGLAARSPTMAKMIWSCVELGEAVGQRTLYRQAGWSRGYDFALGP